MLLKFIPILTISVAIYKHKREFPEESCPLCLAPKDSNVSHFCLVPDLGGNILKGLLWT